MQYLLLSSDHNEGLPDCQSWSGAPNKLAGCDAGEDQLATRLPHVLVGAKPNAFTLSSISGPFHFLF